MSSFLPRHATEANACTDELFHSAAYADHIEMWRRERRPALRCWALAVGWPSTDAVVIACSDLLLALDIQLSEVDRVQE